MSIAGDPTLDSVFPADELAIDDSRLTALSGPDADSQTAIVDPTDTIATTESTELPSLDGKSIVDLPVEASEPENVAQFKYVYISLLIYLKIGYDSMYKIKISFVALIEVRSNVLILKSAIRH